MSGFIDARPMSVISRRAHWGRMTVLSWP